jgi:hypothetical protein
MARTIGAGVVQARVRGGARSSSVGARQDRRTRRRQLSGAIDAAVRGVECGWSRDAIGPVAGVESLEARTMLTAQPVIQYHFTAPPDAGDVVTNSGPLGAAYNGTFQPTGQGGPTRTTRDNTVGDTSLPQAISLNGTTQVIESATPLQSILGKTASLTAWIKTTQAGPNQNPWECPGISGVEDAGTDNDVFWGYIDNNGQIGIAAGNAAAAKSTARIDDGVWHHIALTRDMVSGNVQVYVDGLLNQTVVSATGERGNPAVAPGSLPAGFLFKTIGGIEDEAGVGSRDELAGELDEVLIFDRVLSAADVTAIYTTGPGGGGVPNGTAPSVTVTQVAGRPAQLNLSWTQATPDSNETGYEILRSTSATGPFVVVGSAAQDATSFGDAGLNPATTYFYKVHAINLAGNGADSAAATGATPAISTITGPGTIAEMFNNLVPNNNEPLFGPTQADRRVIRVDPQVNFDWGTNQPDPLVGGDNFSTRWQGSIIAPTAGVYTFVSNSDDAGYLFVKGVLVSQDPGGHGQRDAVILTPITLAAGETVPYVFYQAEGGGGAGVHIKWVPPGGGLQDVPPEAYSTDMTVPAAATNVSASATGNSILLNWTHNAINETGTVVEVKKTTDPDSAYTEVRRFNLAIENPNSGPVSVSAVASGLTAGTSYTFRITDFNIEGNGVTTFTTSTVAIPPGTLNLSQGAAAGDTNLSQPQVADWRHWGLNGPTSTNTKVTGTNAGGVVVFEAETGGVFTDPDADGLTFNVVNEPDASGGQALRSNDSDTNAADGTTAAFVTWTLNFPAAGSYQLFVKRKILQSDGGAGDNSIWRNSSAALDVDPSTFTTTFSTQFDNQGGFGSVYVWTASDGTSPAGQPANNGPVIYNVSTPGLHTLTLAARETGYRMDKIALIPTALVPAGDAARQTYLDSLVPNGTTRSGGPITNFTAIGNGTVDAFSGGNTFTWNNGQVTSTATATPTGVATTGAGNGFRFNVSTSSAPARQLKVFVGVGDGASGTLTAHLSDGSAADKTLTLTDPGGDGQPTFGVFTIDVASGLPNQNLQIDWVSTGGQIILKAAELLETATPTAPQLTAAGTGHGMISLQWPDVSNETGYILERAPDNNGSPGAFATIATLQPNVTAFVDNVAPGTKFHYRLQAVNGLGTTPSSVVSATSGKLDFQGFNATYFDNDNWTGPISRRFDTGVNQVDSGGRGPIDFFWDTRSPVPGVIGPDTFSSRWDGFIIPNFTELYTFYADTDDGARIYVDANENGTFEPDERIFIDTTGHGVGTLRGSNDPVYGNNRYLGGVPLVAGHQYRFRFEQTEGGGGAGARAFWQSPNTPQQIIPRTNAAPLEIPDLTAPTVTAMTVNGHIPATATYTPVFHLTIKFSEPVNSVEDTDFTVFSNSLGELDGNTFDVAYDAASQTAIMTFPNFGDGTLPNADYELRIKDLSIFDTFGNALDGNGDGQPGGATAIPFYVFTGDTQLAFDGSPKKDRTIDFVDYQILARNFGKTNMSGADGDTNYDGVIDNADFEFVRQHFGEQLPVAGAPVGSPAPTPVPVTPVPRPKPAAPKPVPKPVTVSKPVTPVKSVAKAIGPSATRAPQTPFANKKVTGVKDWLASN